MDKNLRNADQRLSREPSFHELGFAETAIQHLQKMIHYPHLFQKEKSQERGERFFSEPSSMRYNQTPSPSLKEWNALPKAFASRVFVSAPEIVLPNAAIYSLFAGQLHFATAKKSLFNDSVNASVFPYAELFYARSFSLLKRKKKKRDESKERAETNDDWLTANN